MRTTRILMMLAVVAVAAIVPCHAAVLTGVGVSATASDGAFTGIYWNSLYAPEHYADVFLSGAPFLTPLAIGTNTYSLNFMPGWLSADGHYGVNLFFGDNDSPNISVVLTVSTSAIAANGNATTFKLMGADQGNYVPGANTLSFTVGTETVTLTAFSINEAPEAASMSGSMTLEVTNSAIPEPQSAALMLSGTALLFAIGRKKVNRS